MQQSDASGEVAEETTTLRVWRALQRIDPALVRGRVENIDRALAVRNYLDEIQRGKWPEFPTDPKRADRAMRAVAQLGDLLARERQARVALTLAEQRRRGASNSDLAALGSANGELQHPFTHETMRLQRRGLLDVLALSAATPKLAGEPDEAEEAELVWRVPLNR
ncbi:MAG TPA: hypothetical protein VHD62_13030 [Opitutaceae bacterium]|nr:hypothetical protein [Opitutaceae bacterium]